MVYTSFSDIGCSVLKKNNHFLFTLFSDYPVINCLFKQFIYLIKNTSIKSNADFTTYIQTHIQYIHIFEVFLKGCEAQNIWVKP